MLHKNTLTTDKVQIWRNTDNAKFVENLSLEAFYNMALSGALDSGKDVNAMLPYIKNAHSILEIGAGYGRVLNHVIMSGYQGKLACIERSPKFCQWLRSQYHNRITVFETNLTKFLSEEKFDLILWMWSGFAEFSKSEQFLALKNIVGNLTSDGKIIIDNIPLDEEILNAVNKSGQEYIISTPFGTVNGYIPSNEEIYQYADELGMHVVERITYQTLPNRNRWLYIISK